MTSLPCDSVVLCGISNCFQLLSPSVGQIAHALLTRPPLECQPKPTSSFDLHVLSTPPAFVLSQDQTLLFNPSHPSPKRANAPGMNSISTLPESTVLLLLVLCIVFKDRVVVRLTTNGIIPACPSFVNTFLNFVMLTLIFHSFP